jgi:hypothetical protein
MGLRQQRFDDRSLDPIADPGARAGEQPNGEFRAERVRDGQQRRDGWLSQTPLDPRQV